MKNRPQKPQIKVIYIHNFLCCYLDLEEDDDDGYLHDEIGELKEKSLKGTHKNVFPLLQMPRISNIPGSRVSTRTIASTCSRQTLGASGRRREMNTQGIRRYVNILS
jgi:hypothetical protein